MTRRKATVMWRPLDAVPDRPLALDFIEPFPGYDRILLRAIDDDDYVIQIMQTRPEHAKDVYHVHILDPQEKWVEDFSETED